MNLRCKNIIDSKVYKDDKGSSSVLVILVMLLLITFGVLAMMSSYSNLKIARKNASWTQGYYLLESEASLAYNKVVKIIDEAKVLSDALIDEQAQIKWALYPFDDGLKTALDPLLQEAIPPEISWLKRVLFHWSFYQLYNAQVDMPVLEPMRLEDLLESEQEIPFVIEYVTVHEATGRKLLVALDLDPDDKVIITQWREIPAEFDYSNSIGFSDPEENE